MDNVITLGKLIGLLFCLPLLLLLSINVHTKNTRNELARLVMGIIFPVFIPCCYLHYLDKCALIFQDNAPSNTIATGYIITVYIMVTVGKVVLSSATRSNLVKTCVLCLF